MTNTHNLVADAILALVLALSLAKMLATRTRLKFEPRDLWVGVFWDRRPIQLKGDHGSLIVGEEQIAEITNWTITLKETLHVYVCLIPTVVFHFDFER